MSRTQGNWKTVAIIVPLALLVGGGLFVVATHFLVRYQPVVEEDSDWVGGE